MNDDPLAPESLDPNDVIAAMGAKIGEIGDELARVRLERDHLANLVVVADCFGAYGRPRTRADATKRTIAELVEAATASPLHALHAGLAAAIADHDRRAAEPGR